MTEERGTRAVGPVTLHAGEQYAVITQEQIRRALAAKPASAARVYLALRGAMGGASTWFIMGGMSEIGALAGVSATTARRCLAALVAVGLLSREERVTRSGGDAPPAFTVLSPAPDDPVPARSLESTAPQSGDCHRGKTLRGADSGGGAPPTSGDPKGEYEDPLDQDDLINEDSARAHTNDGQPLDRVTLHACASHLGALATAPDTAQRYRNAFRRLSVTLSDAAKRAPDAERLQAMRQATDAGSGASLLDDEWIDLLHLAYAFAPSQIAESMRAQVRTWSVSAWHVAMRDAPPALRDLLARARTRPAVVKL